VHRRNHRNHRAGAGQRLHGQRVTDVIEAGAPPFLRNRHSHQTERGGFADQIARKRARLVDLRRARGDAIGGELFDALPVALLIGSEFQNHRAP
jgi:hypothetical protein